MSLVLITGCKKDDNDEEEQQHVVQMINRYCTIEELKAALMQIDSIAYVHQIFAYKDTLPDGMPDTLGAKEPLNEFINFLIYQIEMGQIDSAVAALYRFNGMPFSLFSYLKKAKLAGKINANVLINALAIIPLPPIMVPNFIPPKKPVVVQQQCKCDPVVKILVSWVHKPPCGNFDKKYQGYAVNNKLNMSSGNSIRLDAEVHGCDCEGSWTNTIKPIGVTSYGSISKEPNSVDVVAYSTGSFEITFKFTCKDCGKTASATFIASFN